MKDSDIAPAMLAELQAAAHLQTLRDEELGVRHRIEYFYSPLFLRYAATRGKSPESMRVLDCGCGNGASAEYLASAGFQAYGIDVAGFRIEQWPERVKQDRVHLLAADATALPFADGSFDIVLSCGMLEHIGVHEVCTPEYHVEPLPNQAGLRAQFLAESLRILKPGGVVFVDHPNGRFPIDFWHNDYRARPRFHSSTERFLPSFREVMALARRVNPKCKVSAISPAGRFTFRRSNRRWYGKLLSRTMERYFELLRYRPFSSLASTALNPYLVIQITRS
jgi:SAM-dependent methyltransferase